MTLSAEDKLIRDLLDFANALERGEDITKGTQKLAGEQATRVLRAYIGSSDKIQAVIREMLQIIDDPETDPDDRDMALFTLVDALFPNADSHIRQSDI